MTNRILVVGDAWATAPVFAEGKACGNWLDMLEIPAELRQGVMGSTAPYWAADNQGCMTRALGTEADAVILTLGYEDLWTAWLPGCITVFEATGVFLSFKKTVEALRGRFGDKVYVLLQTLPLDNGFVVDMFNGALMALAPEGTKFINAQDVIDKSCFVKCSVYPTEAGHKQLAGLIRGALSIQNPHVEIME